MYEDFVRERITQLRLKKGISEYQMSYDLGHSRGYVYNISSGKALIQKAIDGLKQLDENDILMLLGIINRFLKKT